MIYVGVVENRDDPLQLGRCQVRIVGLHTEDKTALPTSDLPWAYPMQPISSAAMNGIGWTPVGVVPGTWVVILFQDEDCQMPIMLGSLGGIPQSQSALKASIDGELVSTGREAESPEVTADILSDLNSVVNNLVTANAKKEPGTAVGVVGGNTNGTQTVVTNKVDPSANAIAPDAQNPVGAPSSAAQKLDIPTRPPGKYYNSPKQEESIKALIAACDRVGLTSKYAKCSILAICGGESNWLPVEEGYFYPRPQTLLSLFPAVFQGDVDLATKYSSWRGTRADFFRFIYSPLYKNGKGAGNTQPNDGALFYGRGFNQITGRALYEQLERELKKLGIDAPISTKPELLINDINTSALVTVMFYKLNVRQDQNSPYYFEAALKRTGGAESGKIKKRTFYQYFIGDAVIPDSTNKPDVNSNPSYSAAEVAFLPKNKRDAYLEDRSKNNLTGFTDPSGKYPLRNLMDESDTNRLARGIIKETAIEFKDSTRTTGVPTANGAEGTWEQPLAPFGGQYPFAKVYESESGHLMVFDDSSGNESISLYHRTGTFTDVDANGTQVNKIIGDGYVVIDRNGFISIAGKCNITVGGGATVLVQGDCDLEVKGTTTATLRGEVNLGCARDVNWAIGGDLNIKASTIRLAGDKEVNMQSQNVTMKGTNVYTQVDGDFHVRAGGNTLLNAQGALSLDGAMANIQNGSSEPASTVDDIAKISLSVPEASYSSNVNFAPLKTPVRPSPAVILKSSIVDGINKDVADFIANPTKYYNADAEAGGVNAERPPQAEIGTAGQSLISGAEAVELIEFLKEQYALSKEGYWTETGMRGGPSNPNILKIWKDIGLGSIGTSDQVPWCMAWVNWVLKQCNYRYVQSARAWDMRDGYSRWGATKVDIPQPGDMVVWSYGHINFVYDVLPNGNITCIGGNQGGGRVSNNNPIGGLVTISYPGGVSPRNSSIVGIYRPSNK